MYLQTHPGINRIHPYAGNGCKISSYFYWSELVNRSCFTEAEIEEVTQNLIFAGYLSKDLAVYKEFEKIVPCELGLPVTDARREGPSYVPQINEIGILRLDKPYFHHFVPGFYIPYLGRWGYSWDSLGIRPGRDKYKITGIRIMTLDVSRLNFSPVLLNPLN